MTSGGGTVIARLRVTHPTAPSSPQTHRKQFPWFIFLLPFFICWEERGGTLCLLLRVRKKNNNKKEGKALKIKARPHAQREESAVHISSRICDDTIGMANKQLARGTTRMRNYPLFARCGSGIGPRARGELRHTRNRKAVKHHLLCGKPSIR